MRSFFSNNRHFYHLLAWLDQKQVLEILLLFTVSMEKPTKKISRIESVPDFEESDHRLACGWHVDIEGSGQRKRFLRALKSEEQAAKSA